MTQTTKYQSRCSFGAPAGMTKGSACGRLVGRGSLLCADHADAMVCKRAGMWTSVRLAGAMANSVAVGAVAGHAAWALAAVMAVGTELAMVALTWAS
jgi:hypothetical protein